MAKFNVVSVLLFMTLFLPVVACTEGRSEGQGAVFEKRPEIIEIRPQKPVKIKLKRNSNGNYSWELNGDNPEKVIETDGKLRKALEE